MLLVETVEFIKRIRLPDGRHETTVSMQNDHQLKVYDVSVDPKIGVLTIRYLKAPNWTVLIPLANCSFVVLKKISPAVARGRAKKIKVTVDSAVAPQIEVLTPKKRAQARK